MLGFESLKDILEVVLVPIILAVLALSWPQLQARYRRKQFERLIVRELKEASPYPLKKERGYTSWIQHQKKDFLHKKILEEPTENRDFILSLDPTLAYNVSQLWAARKEGNHTQWLHYLKEIANRHGGEIEKVHEQWKAVIKKEYGLKNTD